MSAERLTFLAGYAMITLDYNIVVLCDINKELTKPQIKNHRFTQILSV